MRATRTTELTICATTVNQSIQHGYPQVFEMT